MRFRCGLRLWALGLLLLGSSLAPRAWAAPPQPGDGPSRLITRYFTISYPAGEEQTASWYAGFADDVDTAVSELLGAEPVGGINLRIYATEADYQAANPVAEYHPDILAHALPERKEIGVAVERLRAQAPDLARLSFRHEMTHIVAGALTNQHLTASFQEGLAQYNELSGDRAAGVAQVLQAAQGAGVPLLAWADLEDNRQFQSHLEVAYPESYTVMAFLADRYGMGAFAHFLARVGTGEPEVAALQDAYGQSQDALETQWRAYLPGFFKDGWQVNVLSAYDLAPGRALYDAGRFAEARDYFARSENLYRDLGRAARVTEASGARTQAEQAQGAVAALDQAQQSLAAHDYAAAQQQATQAQQTFGGLQLASYRDRAATTATQAGQGLAALVTLQAARGHVQLFGAAQAAGEAQTAGAAFAALGDGAHLAEANAILADVWDRQRLAGLGAVGAGTLIILLGAGAAVRGRRRRARPPAGPVPEEGQSWL